MEKTYKRKKCPECKKYRGLTRFLAKRGSTGTIKTKICQNCRDERMPYQAQTSIKSLNGMSYYKVKESLMNPNWQSARYRRLTEGFGYAD